MKLRPTVAILTIVALLGSALLPLAQAQGAPVSVLRFCVPSPGKASDLNPYFYTASPPLTHGMILKLIYETLAEERADGTLEPLLAVQWQSSQDGRAITIRLRPGVLWHDGQPFTSKDVAFTISTIKRYPHGDVYSIGRYVDSVDTPDQLTVVVRLSQPFSRFLYYVLTGYRIFPEHVFKGQDMSSFPARDPAHVVGTGPYRLVEASFDAQIFRFRAFDRYWGGAPQITDMVVQVVDEAAPLPVMLKTGQCSVAAITNPALVAPVAAEPVLRIAVAKGWPYQGSYYTPAGLLVINTALHPLNITAFRQALAHAINKDRIVQLALQGFGEPASSGQLPMSSPWRPGDLEEVVFNTTRAREILRSLGFVEGSDGMFRYPNGSPVSLKIIHTGGLASNVAPLVVQDWRRAGIDASEEAMTRLAYVNSLAYGHYQVALLLTNRPLDADFILTVFMDRNASPTPVGQPTQYWGWTRYVNPDFNLLIERARQAVSEREAHRYYAEAQRIAARDQWVIPLYYSKAVWVFNTRDFGGWDPLYSGEGFPSHAALATLAATGARETAATITATGQQATAVREGPLSALLTYVLAFAVAFAVAILLLRARRRT